MWIVDDEGCQHLYEVWSLIKDTCVSWDWTHAHLIQCLFQLARDWWCPLSVTTPQDRNYRQIKIVSDLCMCLCLPGAKLAYFVSAGTFGSYLYCTWAEVLSTLRRVRAWRFTWNWAAWLGLAWHSLITRGPRKPIIPHATFLSQKRGKIVVRKNPCINSITLKIDPYEEVSDWGPGWVREEAEIKSVISRLKLALSS